MVVGGVVYAKAAERWRSALAPAARLLPAVGYDTVVVAAALGAVVVEGGAVLALPAFVRLVRSGRGGDLAGPVLGASVLSVMALASVAGLSVWAHHLDVAQRNGADAPYGAAFVAVGALAALSLWAWTAVGLRTIRRLDLSRAVLRAEALLALLLTLAMAVIAGGVGLGGAGLRRGGGAFLGGPARLPVTPELALAAAAMAGGLVLALAGSVRVVRSWAAPAQRSAS